MNNSGVAEHHTLLDLVDSSRWQRLQDHFARVLGIPIRTVNIAHQLLVPPSWPSTFDTDRTIELLKVGEEIDQLIPPQTPPAECTSVTTSLGVTYPVIPIRATDDLIVSCFVIGPMVVGVREDELQFRQRITALGLDPSTLWPLLLSLKLYTFAGIRSILTLMEEVGTSLAQFAYQARQLSAILPPPAAADQAVVTYHTDRALHSLLDAATLATRADGGSIMVYDPKSQTLQIHAAQGLSGEIVANARLKRGEGIAGLALAERSILLIDEQTQDPRLKERMQRKELVSSLVAPLASDASQEPIGVLSLRSTTPNKRFTQEHVELLRRLLELAGVALSSLRGALTPPPSPA